MYYTFNKRLTCRKLMKSVASKQKSPKNVKNYVFMGLLINLRLITLAIWPIIGKISVNFKEIVIYNEVVRNLMF